MIFHCERPPPEKGPSAFATARGPSGVSEVGVAGEDRLLMEYFDENTSSTVGASRQELGMLCWSYDNS